MPMDVFGYGALVYLGTFFFCYFLAPIKSDVKGVSVIAGLLVSAIGFVLWYAIFDGIEGRTLGELAEKGTVFLMAVIYALGIALGVFASKFVPEKSNL